MPAILALETPPSGSSYSFLTAFQEVQALEVLGKVADGRMHLTLVWCILRG
jgi:hypothetical protein